MADIKRKLATIETITNIRPIEGADSIEQCSIRGWNVVIKKGQFSEGDLCIYCEIDSILPERSEFEFLRPRNFRIKTIKLKNIVSQGIVFPLSILDNAKINLISGVKIEEVKDKGFDVTIPIGSDLTEALGIIKYEESIPACLSGQVLGKFPSHSIKTDEERITNLNEIYDDLKKETYYVSEKLDGSNINCFLFENKFSVASRNLVLKEDNKNSFWKVAKQLNIEEKMREFIKNSKYEALTIQGELIGEGIQKNVYKIKGQTARFFRVFDPINYQFLPYEEAIKIIEEIGLDFVPIIEDNFTLPDKLEDLVLYADGKSKLYDIAREGIVLVGKSPNEKYQGRLSFKVISNKYILKHDL